MLILLIVSIIAMILLSKYVLLGLSPMILNIVKIAFVLVICFLAYLNFNSIDSKIVLTESVEIRNKVVRERLEQIRDAQVEYKKVRGEYAKNFDNLIDFLSNDSIPQVKMEGEVPDSLLGKEALALEMGIIKRDTTKIPVREILFVENFNKVLDSLAYIPYSGGVKFTMDAGKVEKGKVVVGVFEAKASLKDVYKGLKTDNEGIDMSEFIAIGSMDEPTTNGNWK